MTQSTHCPTCGQRLERWESLSKGLVQTLVKIGRAVATLKRNDIHLRKDLMLDKIEYNNAQKLRYFGLIAKVKVAGQKRSGRWLLTKRGAQFLRGDIAIPKRIRVKNNRVDGYSESQVKVDEIIGYSEAYWMREKDYEKQSSKLF